MIVVLLGYMGSGKSTVGQILAKNLDFNFLDLDHYIEQNQKVTISEIFKAKGEIVFRKLESEAVKHLCSQSDKLVLALGGGTPCYADTMSFLVQHPNVITVALNISVKNLSERLVKEKASRPLIANIKDEDISEFIAKHLFERSFFYNQAEISIQTDSLSIAEIVATIDSKITLK
ncbi:shikimate kinase [Flavobacteriaceae bacterium]|jgi:shikimate kinase|nr:shikimate kinase [Flavobacteriaceae bacterium]MDG1384875.1 shikimate kinase [Flavobacteriaceae bacterium]